MMNKSAKDYTCRRIRTIKQDACESLLTVEKPILLRHVKTAVISGQAKVKANRELITIARDNLAAGYQDSLSVVHIFQQPKSYTDAVAAFEANQKETEETRRAIQEYATKLQDSVQLGAVENGATAIEQMQEFVRQVTA